MKVVAIIQARMGSTRLPGKVLRVLGSATVLEHVIHRVRRAPNIDDVVVATTESPNDVAIVEEARRLGVNVFCGSEVDVLSRYYFAAKQVNADVVLRVTSDCPLLDPEVMRAMVDKFQTLQRDYESVDYLSNTLTRTYPRGLDVEVFTFEALERAYREATSPAEREHVTPYLYRYPEKFRIGQYLSDVDHSRYRWTLDTEDDWQLLKQIFDRLGKGSANFSTGEVMELLVKEPQLAKVNTHVAQKTVGH